MASASLDKKIAKATLVLGGCNIVAAIVFLIGYKVTGEWLFMLAAVLMALAGIGIFILSRRIKSKLSNIPED